MSEDDQSADGGTGAGMSIVRTVVPNFIRKRFALKFLIVLLLMGVAIGAVGAVATDQISEQTQDRIEGEYRGLAVQESNLISQWAESNRLSTRLTSTSSEWAGEANSEMQQALRERANEDLSSDVRAVHVIEQRGDAYYAIASTRLPSGTQIDGGEQDWIADVSFGDPSDVRVSNVYRTSGGPSVGFVSPVSNTENRYLMLEVATGGIASELQGAERAEGGFTMVVNASGVIQIDEKATNPELDSEALQAYGDQTPIDRALSLSDQPSAVISERSNSQVMDEEYAVGFAPVLVSGAQDSWTVLVHAPTSVLFGFVQTVSQFGMLATGGAVLVMLVIGAVLGYNTSSSIERLTAKAEEMEEGNLDVDIESGRIDSIGRLYDGFGEMRDALREQIDEAERARKEAEVSRAEAMEMNTYLQDTAEQYSEIMQACARGDLTRRMEPEGENEAMDQIAEEFNEMLTELEMTTGQLKTFAVEVEESGRSVQQSAETVRDASEQVADSIQKISDDSYNQKERLQRISEEMDGVADQLEAFADRHPDVDFGDALDSIEEVASMIDEAAELGEETMAESENVAGAAEEQAAELNEVSSQAEELTRYAEYLGDGLSNFETEEEHEFVFQTGAGSTGPGAPGPGGDE